MGKHWLRRRVRASKYGVYDSVGVLGFGPGKGGGASFIDLGDEAFWGQPVGL